MFPLALTLEVKHQKEERGRAYRIEHSCLQTPPTPNTLRATRSRLACLSLEGKEKLFPCFPELVPSLPLYMTFM